MNSEIKSQLEEQRKRLLDLTSRNKLLNYKHSLANTRSKRQSYLRIVDEIPEFIIDRLESEKSFELIPKPKDIEYTVDLKLISEVDSLSNEQKDNKIQVLEEIEVFEPSCDKLINDNRLSNQERGINVLQIAIGFLSWFETKGIISEEERLSPLLLYPVEITKKRSIKGYKYEIQSTGEDIKINTTLWRKLRETEGLKLPELKIDDDGNILIKDLFAELRYLLNKRNSKDKKRDWSLKSWSTIGLFSFSNISIYNDLDFTNWEGNPLLEKDILKSFVQGTPCNQVESMGSLNLYQDQEENLFSIDEIPNLIADADSTQYAVIKKSLEGKSLVVQGPPGTGKSQTITNIISSLLSNGKSVLFAADKLAALEVVRNRLADKDLEKFCLEIHSTGTAKIKIIEKLKQRLFVEKKLFSNKKHQEKYQKLKELRKLLNDHSKTLNESIELKNDEVTIHDLIWSQINFDLDISTDEEKEAFQKASQINLEPIPNTNIDLISTTINNLSNKVKQFGSTVFLKIISTNGLPDTETKLSNLISKSSELVPILHSLKEEIKASNLKWEEIEEITLDELEIKSDQIKDLATKFFISKEKPLNQKNLNKLSGILEKVIEREASQENLSKWTENFLINEDKFKSVKICLEEILEAYSKDYEHISTVKECLEALQASTSLLRNINRNFSRINPSLLKKCNISLIINASEIISLIDKESIKIINNLLVRAESRDEVEDYFYTIGFIKKTTSLAIKIKELGLDPNKVCEIDPKIFKDAEEAIRSTSFMGCILDKEVRSAKKLWRKCCLKDQKRPNLANLAKIYFLANDYSKRIVEEKTLTSSLFDIEEIKEHSEFLKPSNELKNYLLKFIYLAKDLSILNNEKEIVFSKCVDLSTLNNQSLLLQLNKTSIEKIYGLSLENAQSVVSKLNASIKTKLSLIDESNKDNILLLNYFELDNLVLDIETFKQSANKLKEALIESEIFSGSGLEYSISSIFLEELIKYIKSINIDLWKDQLKNAIEISGINATLKILDKFNDLKNKQTNLRDLLLSNPINDYLKANKCIEEIDQINNNLVNDFLLLLDKNKENQQDILQVLRDKNTLNNCGVSKGITEIIDISNKYNVEASIILKYALISRKSKDISLEEKISSFSGEILNSTRALFCETDKEFILSSSKYLHHNLCKSTENCLLDGNNYGSPKNFTEGPLIKHEIKKQKRHLPMRLFLSQAFESISNLKPCWMMSPASAAELLPKKSDIFDVLIIDEASQMKPEKAFSLIARCKQLIIVGDRKQLPPTNFFQKQDSQKEDEDIEIEDNESILELADKVISDNGCSLGWHYRSRHQSLIAFSNHYFYDDSLTIFASNSVGSEVKLHQVINPNYRSGVNLPEVEETIKALKKQVSEDSSKSILIATMNEAQTSELRIALEKEIALDSDLSSFADKHKGTLDELVVKNLENVQGDERDVVIISTVYGPNADGRVMQNFGPINKESGWRRLNVLFTRAKHRVILVSSLKSSDIVITPSSSRGVQALKNYLIYAETTKITDSGIKTTGEVESPFEEAVFNSLKERGYLLDLQVGVGAYRIDIAVKDNKDPNKYLLAIECDGAAYHSSYSARARDRLRQEVLEGLGWKVYRIWSTDWFRDPKGELDKLEKEIQSITT